MYAQTLTTPRARLGVLLGALLLVAAAGAMAFSRTAKADPAPANGSSQYFLKLDSIDGDSTDAQHKNEIEVKTFAWGDGKPGILQTESSTGTGGGAGKATVSDIHFTALVSKASPKLMTAAASGKHFKDATISVRAARNKAGKQDYFTIKLSDVLVSSYAVSGSGDTPVDAFDLSFNKIEESFVPTNADGSLGAPVVGSFDVKASKTE
jgi:type VI secretion system secreted protein Hcp